MKVSWTERARADLAAIAITIAGERGRFVAEKWRNRLVASTGSLAKMPFIVGEVREVGREDIREVGVPPYRAIYRVRHDHCEILTIVHSRQLLSHEDLQS